MYLIPAVDILDGRPVRLLQGEYESAKQYGDSPIEAALRWQEAGAQWLHVVDLDGARTGRPVNGGVVRELARQTSLRLQVGGGLRTERDVAELLEAGVERAVLGTAAVRSPGLLQAVCRAFPGRIVVALDVRAGQVAVEGWTESTGVPVEEAATAVVEAGAPRLLFTVIERDGTQVGPDLQALRALVSAVSVPVIASGGVGSVGDLEMLAATGVEAVVVGRALYEGSVPVSVLKRYAGGGDS